GHTSMWWLLQARNKKSITLDLRKVAGRELALDLVRRSDVVLENFRPGTLEWWNLGYEAMCEVNPDLTLVRLSGFGQTGPYRDRPTTNREHAPRPGTVQHLSVPGGPVGRHRRQRRCDLPAPDGGDRQGRSREGCALCRQSRPRAAPGVSRSSDWRMDGAAHRRRRDGCSGGGGGAGRSNPGCGRGGR